MLTVLVALTIPLVAGQLPPREPIKSLGVQGRYVTINDRPTFLVGQMSYEFARGRTTEDIRKTFENPRTLTYQEAYVCKLLETLKEVHYILSPFGEVRVGSKPYFDRWLRLFTEHEHRTESELLVEGERR